MTVKLKYLDQNKLCSNIALTHSLAQLYSLPHCGINHENRYRKIPLPFCIPATADSNI